MKTRLMIAAAAMTLFTLPASAQVMSGPMFVATAGASDLYEKTSSQLVLETTQDPAIRSFATMMVADHAKSTAAVKAAAAKARIKSAPPKLNPAQAEMIAQLRAEPAATRDAAYVAQQKTAHAQALNVHKTYAMEGTVAPLKATAAQIAPVVQHHIDMLKTM